MEDDLKWLGISCKNDDFSCSSVKSLGCFVGSLSELLVVVGLLNEVEDCGSQVRFGERVSLGRCFIG